MSVIEITVDVSTAGPGIGNELTNTRLNMTVSAATGISQHLFVHQQYNQVRDSGLIVENRFISVAKPGDLEVLPIGAPDPVPVGPPFFRTNCLDVIFDSPITMSDAITSIKEELQQLLNGIRMLEDLILVDSFTLEG